MSSKKHLIFSLKNEYYGLDITAVKEIIAMQKITPVPKTQEFIQGIINLRGTIISIIDLRIKLGIEKKDYNERTIIIVTEVIIDKIKRRIGIAVDSVSEVLDMDEGIIEEVNEEDIDIDDKFIKGIGKLEDKVVLLIDIDKILSKVELKHIK